MTMKDIKDNLSYWLALEAVSFVYQDEAVRAAALGADNTCVWRLDCGNLCEYAATAKLRKETKQFMTFDVQIAGGTLDEEWHVSLLAFRGSVTLQDWLTNAGAVRNLEPFDQIAVGVHAGWHAYVSDPAQHAELKTAISGLSNATSILVCGHSLGGALSQITMLFLWLQMQDKHGGLYRNQLVKNARCITFGSPAPLYRKRSPAILQRGGLAKQHLIGFRTNASILPTSRIRFQGYPLMQARSFRKLSSLGWNCLRVWSRCKNMTTSVPMSCCQLMAVDSNLSIRMKRRARCKKRVPASPWLSLKRNTKLTSTWIWCRVRWNRL